MYEYRKTLSNCCLCSTYKIHQKFQIISNNTVSVDILVWTNENVISWLDSIGMEEFTINLLHSGVHGGLIALDDTYDYEKLAMALQIPTSNTTVSAVMLCVGLM